MELAVTVRHLLFVNWEVPADDLAAKLPDGVELDSCGGSGLVTLAFARAVRPRLGRVRVAGFAKLTLHTYVRRGDEAGLCFLDLRVSPSAFAGPALGMPTRTTRIRVRPGRAAAPALRASFRYEPLGLVDPPELDSGPLGLHELAFFEAAGLRRLRAPHDEIRWRAAELLEPPRFDPVTAAGFDVRAPASILYADGVRFRAELPPTPA